MSLASDSGDSRLMVRFYAREIEIPYRTNQEQRPIYQMADFIRIEVPGDRLNVIDTIVEEGHRQRFPIQWAAYKNEQENHQVEGTPLSEWPLITRAQAQELRHYKFYTVEQVAGASDQQLSGIGMLIGMGGSAFRDKASAYLAKARDASVVNRQSEELAKRDAELADLKAQVASLVASQDAPRRGRPPKVVEVA